MPDVLERRKPFRLARLRVSKLWGLRSFDIKFHKQVNVLIGRNGSGKTTLINLMRFVLSGDVVALAQLDFDEIRIDLRGFSGQGTSFIAVKPVDEGFVYKGDGKAITEISVPSYLDQGFLLPRRRRLLERSTAQLREMLAGTVPAVWLPVTRRLPSAEQDEDPRRRSHRGRRLESVDQRLQELHQELTRYRIQLDASLAREYKRFEREVLSLILYRKDRFTRRGLAVEAPTEEEKIRLIAAFRDAGLMDTKMSRRIDEHFEASRRVAENIRDRPDVLAWDDMMVLPLIPRTQEMVKLATDLEARRQEIFTPLRRFEEIVNGFLNDKAVRVLDDGRLRVFEEEDEERQFELTTLSSGEKQLLILLTEALLREDEPVVYVADEPELSLHVEWQERLLRSLLDLAGKVQLVVATHSPDIVSDFQEHVIKLDP